MRDVIRDILDKQLVDREQRKVGKVDGIIIELRQGEPPRLAYLEVGPTVLARRLHPWLEKWVAALERKLGLHRKEPYRIPWGKVRDIGVDLEVDLDATKTPVLAWERFLSQKIVRKIPGS